MLLLPKYWSSHPVRRRNRKVRISDCEKRRYSWEQEQIIRYSCGFVVLLGRTDLVILCGLPNFRRLEEVEGVFTVLRSSDSNVNDLTDLVFESQSHKRTFSCDVSKLVRHFATAS